MGNYELEGPDGSVYELETPDGVEPTQDQINSILGQVSSTNTTPETPSLRPSQNPILPESLRAGDGIKNLLNKTPGLLANAMPGVGGDIMQGIAGLLPGPGDFLPGVTNSTYGGIARGIGQGAGEALGALAGVPTTGGAASIPGAIMGGTMGNILADRGVHEVDDYLTGQDTPYTSDEFSSAALEGVGGGLFGRLMPKAGIVDDVKRQAIEVLEKEIGEKKVADAYTTIAKTLNPTIEEAASALPGIDVGATSFGDMPKSIRNDIIELTKDFGMSFKSPEEIQGTMMKKMGYNAQSGNFIEGELPRRINDFAKALDNAAPEFSVNDKIPIAADPAGGMIPLEASFNEWMKQAVKSEADKYGKVGREYDKILEDGFTRIDEINKALVPEKVRTEYSLKSEKLGAIQSNIAKLEREAMDSETRLMELSDDTAVAGDELSGKLLNTRDGLPKSAKSELKRLQKESVVRKSELQRLKNEESVLKADVDKLEPQVLNPKQGFYDTWQLRVQLDKLAADAHEGQDTIGGNLLKAMSNAVRDFENTRASMIDPNLAAGMERSQREFSLLSSITDAANRNAAQVFKADPKPHILRKLHGYIPLNLVTGTPRFGLSADALRSFSQKETKELMSKADAIIKAEGTGLGTSVQAEMATLAADARKLTNMAARGITATTVSREAGDYLQAGGLKALENAMMIQTLFDNGVINAQQKEDGVDLNQLSQINPEGVNASMMAVSQNMSMIKNAIEFGDEDDAGVALSQVAKMYPGLFPRPRTGIKGEVTVNGETKLYDPIDRAKYLDMTMRRKDVDWEKKAEISSELNDSWTVLP